MPEIILPSDSIFPADDLLLGEPGSLGYEDESGRIATRVQFGTGDVASQVAMGGSYGGAVAEDAVALSPFGWASGSSLIDVSDELRAEEIENMVAAGAKWCRFDLDWWAVEGTEGVRDWSRWDEYLTDLKDAEVKPILMIGHTPPWARGGTGGTWTPPTDNADFGDFCAAAVARYANATYNCFHYELWNEPNISSFWNVSGGPAAGSNAGIAKYVGMIQDAYPKMKAAVSTVTVLVGATAPSLSDGTSIDPREYVEGMYAAGVGDYCDAISHHPYVEANLPTEDYEWSAWSQMHVAEGVSVRDGGTMLLPSLRDTMTANGDADKRIWATEANVLADDSEGPTGVFATEARQAVIVPAMYEAWRAYDWSGVLCVYNYQGDGDWSFRNSDGTLKPAYGAYRDCPKYVKAL